MINLNELKNKSMKKKSHREKENKNKINGGYNQMYRKENSIGRSVNGSIGNSKGSQRTFCPALMSAPLSKSIVAILRWPLNAAIINAV
jgi:hypothetical protein